MIPILGVICGKNIRDVCELSHSEYEQYKQAVGRLGIFMRDQELIIMVRKNYEDFVNLLIPYSIEYTKGSAPPLLPMERLSFEINTRILNFLSSVRTFLDHSETYLKRRYDKDPERFKKFKEACSNAYDNNFSYKFIYHLRNYAQHCGMPVSRLQFNKKTVDRQTLRIGSSIVILCDRDELLANHDWKKATAQLREQPKEIPIGFHMQEMLECLWGINLILIEQELPTIEEGVQAIENLISPLRDEIKDEQCTPIIFQKVEKLDTGGVNLSFEFIPVGWVGLFKDIYLVD